MICPRCGTDLRKEKQDRVDVDRCPACWGTWLDKGEFPTLLASATRSMDFSEEEIDSVLKGLVHEANAPKTKSDAALNCPTCGKAMGKVRHNAARLITLDRCDAHGIWCDTKELKQAQVAARALRMVLKQASA